MRIGIKDNIDVAGLPTRAGLGHAPPLAKADAPLVAALRAAGAWIAGKTCMDEAALGATGDNPHTGRCPNPAAPGRSPGGSSSGSAGCVAAGLCEAALGTDTMGSVRIPAAYCGVVGMIPSPGLLPPGGMVPLSPRLDRLGIMAARIGTLRQVMQAVSPGRDTGPQHPRVAVFHPETPHPAVLDGLRWASRAAIAAGWSVCAEPLPEWDRPALRRAALLVAEADGARTFSAFLDRDDPALSDPIRRLFLYGLAAGPERLARAHTILDAAAGWAERLMSQADLLLMPATAHPAYAWDAGPPPDQADWAVLANAARLPAMVIPVGVVPAGMDGAGAPVAIQLVAPPGQDSALLRWAETLERAAIPPSSAPSGSRIAVS